MLYLPSKPANTLLSGREIDDTRRTAADTVAVSVEGVFELEQGVVRDGFNQAGPEERNRHPAGHDRRLRGDNRLTRMAWNREQLEQ